MKIHHTHWLGAALGLLISTSLLGTAQAARLTVPTQHSVYTSINGRQADAPLAAGTNIDVRAINQSDQSLWLNFGQNQWLSMPTTGTLTTTEVTLHYTAPGTFPATTTTTPAGTTLTYHQMTLVNDTLWFQLSTNDWVSGQTTTLEADTPASTEVNIPARQTPTPSDHQSTEGKKTPATPHQPTAPTTNPAHEEAHTVSYTRQKLDTRAVSIDATATGTAFYLTDKGLIPAMALASLLDRPLTTTAQLTGSDGAQYLLVQDGTRQIAWVPTTAAHVMNQTITLPQQTNVFDGYGIHRQYAQRQLPAGQTLSYTQSVQAAGTTWYEIGFNQWVSTDMWPNLPTSSAYNMQQLTLQDTVPVYQSPAGSATTQQITAGTTVPVSVVQTINSIPWYQTADGWISPAYEVTKDWLPTGSDNQLPILMYHDFQATTHDDIYEVPVQEFANQMDWLAQNHYRTLTPTEAYYVLTTHRKPAANVVWLTMDDGYKDWYTDVLPIITAHHMNVTGFQIVQSLDKQWGLTTSELQYLSQHGFSIQSHTLNHAKMANLDYGENSSQAALSKSALTALTSQPVTVLAYPFGGMNDNALDALRDTGYQMGLRMDNRVASITDGLYALPRLTVRPGLTKDQFMALLQQ